MKKILFTILLSLTIMSAYAQSESQHLTFKGVPIDGTLNEYVSKMKQKGFMFMTTQDGTALLKGDFAGYKGCTVGVSTLKQRDLVSKIVVIFPSYDNWSGVSNNYFSLKDMLTEKYGQPANVVEEFQGIITPETDNSKMHELRMDRSKFVTVFSTSKGDIQLSMSSDKMGGACVLLTYFDRINGDVVRSEAMDDL